MNGIEAVNWDVDKVWYSDISTSYCARESPMDPQPYLDRFLGEKWFTHQDVLKWVEYRNMDPANPIKTIGNLADCLTDFLYNIKNHEGKPILTKEQTIEGKQSLLKGLTMKQIREIADRVELTHGLREAISVFNENLLYQVAFSDGLGPFISYMASKEDMDYWGVVPAIVEADGSEMVFNDRMIDRDDVVLTGKSEKYSKSEAFFRHMKESRISLANVAAIDDSGANVPTLKKIIEAGGVAIGFNPTEAHEKDFREAGIPILKQTERSLKPFKEIVLNPYGGTIGRYCV